MTRKPSRRFDSSRLAARLVPVFLIILVIGLLATMVIIFMSFSGRAPGF